MTAHEIMREKILESILDGTELDDEMAVHLLECNECSELVMSIEREEEGFRAIDKLLRQVIPSVREEFQKAAPEIASIKRKSVYVVRFASQKEEIDLSSVTEFVGRLSSLVSSKFVIESADGGILIEESLDIPKLLDQAGSRSPCGTTVLHSPDLEGDDLRELGKWNFGELEVELFLGYEDVIYVLKKMGKGEV